MKEPCIRYQKYTKVFETVHYVLYISSQHLRIFGNTTSHQVIGRNGVPGFVQKANKYIEMKGIIATGWNPNNGLFKYGTSDSFEECYLFSYSPFLY